MSQGEHVKRRLLGVISDTHGLLRPEAVQALAGVERIIHAGDAGAPDVLAELRRLAPLVAVRGNVDKGDWAADLPGTAVVDIGGRQIYVLHNLGELGLDPAAARFAAVIYGHSHRVASERQGGVLYLNPGSAGPRKWGLPATLALLHVQGDAVQAETVDLTERAGSL